MTENTNMICNSSSMTNKISTLKNVKFSHHTLLLTKGDENTPITIKKQNKKYTIKADSLIFIKKDLIIDMSYSLNNKPEYLLLSHEILLEILKLKTSNTIDKKPTPQDNFIKIADKEKIIFFNKLKIAFNNEEITKKNTTISQQLKITYLLLDFNIIQYIIKSVFFSDKVKNIIGSQLNHQWTLKEISNNLFISQSSLRKKLELEKTNFMAILTEMRMRHAIHLLATTELSIGEISELIGYKSSSYFIKTFKKYYHKSPKQLKK